MITKHSDEILRRPLADKQKAELQALSDLPDDQIDLSDIPEFKFTDQTKKVIPVRLDLDVWAWLKQSPGYQNRINEILRREMVNDVSSGPASVNDAG